MKDRLATIWQRICWNAWTYARKREIARRHRKDPQASIADLTLDQQRIQANEARQVLESRHFIGAFDSLESYLNDKMERTDPNQADLCVNLVISKQLLTALRRELERKLEDGYMAEAALDELNRKQRPRRFAR